LKSDCERTELLLSTPLADKTLMHVCPAGEKEPVTDGRAFDGPDCQGKGCLAKFREAAAAAVAEFEKTLVRKMLFGRHFCTKNGHFVKTGSGQT
jgi:hypothetical protein